MIRANTFPALLIAIVAVAVLFATAVWAKPFAEARIIFEVNATDGDAGIQVFLDAEPWKLVTITGPTGQIFEVEAKGTLQGFGLTELFSESNEPPFETVPLQDVLDLFPAGKYEFKGTTVKGTDLKTSVTLSHTLPCGPVILSPAILPAGAATIEWAAVTNELDHATGECGVLTDLEIAGYQVIVGDFQVTLPAEATSVTVPPQFLEPNTLYLFEVLAIEANGNQTITESSFTTTP
ncbi:MAG TPA: hypothetical protein VJ521_05385 [Acidobacteriota bacterium]|nr:hypothetical protein [Acidobacteriota bacterium]